MLKRLSGAIRAGLADDRAVESIPNYAYTRPPFLSLSLESGEVTGLAGYNVSRPILVAGDKALLPGLAGYAETINGGKSLRNEDQAQACQFWLRPASVAGHGGDNESGESILYDKFVHNSDDFHAAAAENAGSTLVTYFALFDGHAGDGAASYARHRLQILVRDRLQLVYELLLAADRAADDPVGGSPTRQANAGGGGSIQQPSLDELVTGALENAFAGLDEEILHERWRQCIKGGCTALVAVFLLGRLFVANAGDTRAVLCRSGDAASCRPLTVDQTPFNDRERIQAAAAHRPELLGGEFSPLLFARRVTRRDVGRRVLCRGPFARGWSFKVITEEDQLFPVITGDAKKSRLLATIGVARGFGDHDLTVSGTNIALKPLLSSVPLVTSLDAAAIQREGGNEAYVVMATDGLWDVLSNEDAAAIVQEAVKQGTSNRCVIAAQCLVGAARGLWLRDGNSGGWRLASDQSVTASLDDISCFVIPLGLPS